MFFCGVCVFPVDWVSEKRAVLCGTQGENCGYFVCLISLGFFTQLVVAESNPRLDGHKLAASLSKVPSIGVTLIPDSNIYALMARVNKVNFAP